MLTWTRTYSPQQQALVLLSISIDIMSFNIDVSVVIDDYHHLRGGGGGAFIKELHDSYVGRACNNCNDSTICWTENFSRTVMFYLSWKGSHTSMIQTRTGWCKFLLAVLSHQMPDWQGFVSSSMQLPLSNSGKMHLHVNCACTIAHIWTSIFCSLLKMASS